MAKLGYNLLMENHRNHEEPQGRKIREHGLTRYRGEVRSTPLIAVPTMAMNYLALLLDHHHDQTLNGCNGPEKGRINQGEPQRQGWSSTPMLLKRYKTQLHEVKFYTLYS